MPADGRVRLALGVVAALVGIAVVLAIIDRLSPEPKGPPSSSYATSPQGLAALWLGVRAARERLKARAQSR